MTLFFPCFNKLLEQGRVVMQKIDNETEAQVLIGKLRPRGPD